MHLRSAVHISLLAGALVLGASPSSTAAQLSPADSTSLVESMHDLQEEFEGYRESRLPAPIRGRQGGCDERIGRICIWFGGAGETDFPSEPTEVTLARLDFLGELSSAADRIRDPWITGQLVHYLVEADNLGGAENVARECALIESWWCSALLGYVLHLDGAFVEAEEAFRAAAASVPPGEESRWRTPRFVVSGDGRTLFENAEGVAAGELWELYWRLSDPLFLVDGNDRLTEHYARLVVAINRENAQNPHLMEWDVDLEETLIRYGRQIGWSRQQGPPSLRGGLQLQDNRSVIGHHDPMSRGYLFPDVYLRAPAEIPPESWITGPREARSWYAAPYAPDFRGLDSQIARFRRGSEMLVVGAYRPTAPERDPFEELAVARAAPPSTPNPFARNSAFDQPEPEPAPAEAEVISGPVQAGLFLVPEGGGASISTTGGDTEGVFTLSAPTGRYVSSLEVFDPRGGRAWRARQGLNQALLAPGLVAASDLLILREGAAFPDDFDAAVADARPGIRVRGNERFTVAWEVYGLDVNQQVQVTLGFTEGRPGFLTRVGEFLGIIDTEQPVEISFVDAPADQVQTLFRAVALELPELAPGEYTLHLRLDLPGREPAISSRPIIVVP